MAAVRKRRAPWHDARHTPRTCRCSWVFAARTSLTIGRPRPLRPPLTNPTDLIYPVFEGLRVHVYIV